MHTRPTCFMKKNDLTNYVHYVTCIMRMMSVVAANNLTSYRLIYELRLTRGIPYYKQTTRFVLIIVSSFK